MLFNLCNKETGCPDEYIIPTIFLSLQEDIKEGKIKEQFEGKIEENIYNDIKNTILEKKTVTHQFKVDNKGNLKWNTIFSAPSPILWQNTNTTLKFWYTTIPISKERRYSLLTVILYARLFKQGYFMRKISKTLKFNDNFLKLLYSEDTSIDELKVLLQLYQKRDDTLPEEDPNHVVRTFSLENSGPSEDSKKSTEPPKKRYIGLLNNIYDLPDEVCELYKIHNDETIEKRKQLYQPLKDANFDVWFMIEKQYPHLFEDVKIEGGRKKYKSGRNKIFL
jgi:hypothetical protein